MVITIYLLKYVVEKQ